MSSSVSPPESSSARPTTGGVASPGRSPGGGVASPGRSPGGGVVASPLRSPSSVTASLRGEHGEDRTTTSSSWSPLPVSTVPHSEGAASEGGLLPRPIKAPELRSTAAAFSAALKNDRVGVGVRVRSGVGVRVGGGVRSPPSASGVMAKPLASVNRPPIPTPALPADHPPLGGREPTAAGAVAPPPPMHTGEQAADVGLNGRPRPGDVRPSFGSCGGAAGRASAAAASATAADKTSATVGGYVDGSGGAGGGAPSRREIAFKTLAWEAWSPWSLHRSWR
mmetsp:Transcript_124140/g.397037  ORF Transcript_124140/g.397037 Transcript_124140/m.397037 type:complete len:279 (+) Transcript_124140:231-1067(+)